MLYSLAWLQASYGGEDAFFISPVGGGAFGVADGVGGWQESGINPAGRPSSDDAILALYCFLKDQGHLTGKSHVHGYLYVVDVVFHAWIESKIVKRTFSGFALNLKRAKSSLGDLWRLLLCAAAFSQTSNIDLAAILNKNPNEIRIPSI